MEGGGEAGRGREGGETPKGPEEAYGDNGYVHDRGYSDSLTILYMSKPITFDLKYMRCIVYQFNFNKVGFFLKSVFRS